MAIVKDICRFICGLIDSIAYLILSKLSDLFNEISQLSLYSEEVMNSIGQRIGLILGIFMLFRLAVALVSYIISPDTMKDSGKGTGKMIKSIIISLILLATVNIIFKEAYKLQRKVIESKIVEKIFFGEQATVSDINISFILYDAFIDPNPRVLANCETLFDLYNPVVNSDCKNSIHNASLNSAAHNTISDSILRYHTFQDLLSTYDALNAKKGNEYVFNYTPVISTISSVIAILILIGFCMDLATRIVKLLFLQIIAPVPIVSNMAPGKGSDVFKNWYKQCINTYLSVFIRIIALNFGIFMITLIKTKFSDIFTGASPFITVLLIIGCLMFAKQVPELLEEIMGIKKDGGMTLNPLKKFQDQALFGKQISGLGRAGVSGAIGAVTGAIGATYASSKLGNKWYQNLGSFVRGAGRGTVGGLASGYKSKNVFGAVGSGFGRWQTNADYVNSLDGTTLPGRMKAALQQRVLHTATDEENTKKDIDEHSNFIQASDSALKRAEAESIKYNTLTLDDGTTMSQHKAMQQKLIRMQNEQIDKQDSKYWTEHKGKWYFDDATYQSDVENRDKEIADIQDKISINQKKFATEYISQVHNGYLKDEKGIIVNDGELDNYVNQIEHYQKELSKKGYNYNIVEYNSKSKKYEINGKNIKDAKQSATVQKQAIEQNYNSKGINVYQQQKANAAATKPKGK